MSSRKDKRRRNRCAPSQNVPPGRERGGGGRRGRCKLRRKTTTKNKKSPKKKAHFSLSSSLFSPFFLFLVHRETKKILPDASPAPPAFCPLRPLTRTKNLPGRKERLRNPEISAFLNSIWSLSPKKKTQIHQTATKTYNFLPTQRNFRPAVPLPWKM